jgi:membrane-associated protease RseP (regulator of RpoE activity)
MNKKVFIAAIVVFGFIIVLFGRMACTPNHYANTKTLEINGLKINGEEYSFGVFGGGYRIVKIDGIRFLKFDQMSHIYAGDENGRIVIASFDRYQKKWKNKKSSDIIVKQVSAIAEIANFTELKQ